MDTIAELVVLKSLVVCTEVSMEISAESDSVEKRLTDSNLTDSVLTGDGDMKLLNEDVADEDVAKMLDEDAADCVDEKICVDDNWGVERGVLVTRREVDDGAKLLNEVVDD